MIFDRAVPVVQLGGREPLALGDDWSIIPVSGENAVIAALSSGVGIVLVHSEKFSLQAIAAIRSSDPVARAVPMGILGGTDSLPQCSIDLDFRLTDLSSAAIVAGLEAWRPLPLPDAYHRLAGTFGADTVRGMALRLCEVLATALEALGTPDLAAAAHKVAGVAGTLGFTDLGAQWLALSHSPGLCVAELRRDTRRTIAAIVLDGVSATTADGPGISSSGSS